MRLNTALAIIFLCQFVNISGNVNSWLTKRKTHKCKTLKNEVVKQLAKHNDDRFKMFKKLLEPMLRVRVAGTAQNRDVQTHIKHTILNLEGWTIEDDSFSDQAPHQPELTHFNNIIATHNADAPRKLVLACHHDSKLMPRMHFIGATDSAVPCAMLLELAITLTPKLIARRKNDLELGLQLIFFDGEEAFVRWQKDDSLYGSRHYANKLMNQTRTVYREVTVNGLEQIDMLVLLDLIGAGGTKFHNWFPDDTGQAFDRLRKIEKRLKDQKQIGRSYFSSSRAPGQGIEDDHIPFIEKGVPCLHLIAFPFPHVWHRETDNGNALDYTEIKELNLILKVFVCEYMHL